ncbi:MAG: immunoglobulin domain-containing protein, partial [Bacteroidales bacterium]|nr:immunoglobulin domain-containing protein [Bacteroidales bacterium]
MKIQIRILTLFLAFVGIFVGIKAQSTNNLCVNADPFCTDENPYGVTFPAGTDATATPDLPSSLRGCLYYTPAPAWYVMQIDQPGDMLIYMQHSNNRDIDFACWGPFTGYNTYGELLQAVCTSQLTNNGNTPTHRPSNGYHDANNSSTWGGYPSGMMVDCSYSAASTEWCYIHNAQVGQWYIFLICNYSRAAGDISFSIQSGEATTNCNILAAISNNGPLCEGEDLQLYCSAYSTSGYQWTGPNGFTSNLQNPVIQNVTTAAAGTYTVVYTPHNSTSPQVGTTTVEVYARPTASVTASQTNVCNGTAVTLTGSSNCNDCQFIWSNGSNQHAISVLPSTTTTYTLTVTNGNCSSVASQTITVGSVPNVAITPAVITLCSAIGSVDLQAISSQCGIQCTYEWSTGETTQTISVGQSQVPSNPTTFTVTCTNSYGCTASATSSVSVTDNPDIADCNVFYVDNSGDPESQGLTPANPTTIQHALSLASCTNAIVRLDTGTYYLDHSIQLASNLTIEGGFFDEFKQKTSEVGATTLFRTQNRVEGTMMAPRIVAMEGSGLNDFRLQDLTIQTADAPALPAIHSPLVNADDKDCYNNVEPGTNIPNAYITHVGQNSNEVLPGFYPFHRYMSIYTAAEMGCGPMTFTAIGYDVVPTLVDVPASGHQRHLKIYLLEVPNAEISMDDWGALNPQEEEWNYWVNTQQAVLVYDEDFCVETGRVTFPINYDYQGGNLMVLLEGDGCLCNGSQDGGCEVNVRGGSTYPSYRSGSSWDDANPHNWGFDYLMMNTWRPDVAFYSCTDRTVSGNEVANVAAGASSEAYPLPGQHEHHRTAALYTGNEIGTGPKMLSGIALNVTSISPLPQISRTRTVRIYMKNTTDVTLTANQVWNQYISNASLVYSGTFCENSTGWTTFPINFAYEGEGLMVMIEGEGCSTSGGCTVGTACSPISNMCVSHTTDDDVYYSINPLSAQNTRPNIKLYSTSTEDDDFYVPESNYGVSTYALHLTRCERYDIVRCRFIAGNAGNGKNGTAGRPGGDGGAGGQSSTGTTIYTHNGQNYSGGCNYGDVGLGGVGGLGGTPGYSAGTAGAATSGGQGGRGGQFNSQDRTVNGGQNGASTINNPNPGSSGYQPATASSTNNSTPGAVLAQAAIISLNDQLTASAGVRGTDGAAGVTANATYSDYFLPAIQANGGDGTGGSGGCGGGGGGAARAQNTYNGGERFAMASGSGGGGGGGGGG